jgi:hypothetical protein
MTNYIAELYVNVLILLSCLGWMALVFWGAIFFAEKLCRWVYQDERKQLYDEPHADGLAEVKCSDCDAPILVNELDETWPRCDLCDAIRHAELESWGRDLQ